jgi:hypothetical protein
MLFSRMGVSGFGFASWQSSSFLLLLLLVAVVVVVVTMVEDVAIVEAVAGVVVGVVVGAAGVEIDFKTDGLTPVRGLGRDISLWLKRTEIRFYFRLL